MPLDVAPYPCSIRSDFRISSDNIASQIDDVQRIYKAKYHETNINFLNIPSEKIDKIINKTNRGFYLNPTRILAIFLAMNKAYFMKHILIGLVYLTSGKVIGK